MILGTKDNLNAPGMELTIFLLGITVVFLLFLLIRWFLELYELDDLENKAVFITGCDSGFGKALAIRCAERGMPVFAGCLFEKVRKKYFLKKFLEFSSKPSAKHNKLYAHYST
ncbi:hypothetical protein Y032_0011g1343 [Ancylostoma ceylanicum]|uniref:Oxidoreductase, short chain dehydrogenase/reductase family protein n=1 Tax=Ancylostoma ceylanicum TaxID=53326 RepID=A0A016VEJ1_9BILA|nr:hypothetical protein Y032_0011g1343 [Ancylostoma ceylanicum]